MTDKNCAAFYDSSFNSIVNSPINEEINILCENVKFNYENKSTFDIDHYQTFGGGDVNK